MFHERGRLKRCEKCYYKHKGNGNERSDNRPMQIQYNTKTWITYLQRVGITNIIFPKQEGSDIPNMSNDFILKFANWSEQIYMQPDRVWKNQFNTMYINRKFKMMKYWFKILNTLIDSK